MAAFYYVRNDGTATGDAGRYATQQTGDWDTTLGAVGNFYTSISAALAATTAPTSGDFICLSSIHDKNYAAHTTLTVPAGVTVIGVNDTSIAVELTGAIERTESNVYDLTITGQSIFKSVTLKAGDDIIPSNVTFIDCPLYVGTVAGGNGSLVPPADTVCSLINSALTTGVSASTSLFVLGVRAQVVLYNSPITSGAGAITNYVQVDSGADFYQYGGNVPSVTTIFANSTIRGTSVQIQNAKLDGYTNLTSGTLYNETRIFIEGCSTANEELSTYTYKNSAWIYTDTGVYLNASDGTTSFSKRIETTSDCGPHRPVCYRLGSIPVDASASKTITIEIAQASGATSLTDKDCWIGLEYQDDTTTRGYIDFTFSTDWFAPANLTTSTSNWTGLTGEVTQKIAKATSQTGKSALADVHLFITKPSVTIYFDPEFTVA